MDAGAEAVGVDPVTAPLTYPGPPPWRPAVLVTDTEVLTLRPLPGRPVGQWLVAGELAGQEPAGREPAGRGPIGSKTTGPGTAGPGFVRPEPGRAPLTRGSGPISGPDFFVESDPKETSGETTDPSGGSGAQDCSLDTFLRGSNGSLVMARTPVLAVGSNASPAQVRRKMARAGLPTRVPITAATVRGLMVGVSAHVSRPGYLPATPVPDPAAESQLWVLWLEDAALAAIDATEPNYHRVRLAARYPVHLTSGQAVTGGWVYLSRHGHLLNRSGQPRRLTDQATLITALLAELPGLQALAGPDPERWIERTRDPDVRDAARELFRSEGLVQSVDGF